MRATDSPTSDSEGSALVEPESMGGTVLKNTTLVNPVKVNIPKWGA